ncbi:MAG: 4Fe-4S dicluster protein [Bacteroidetes bacterium]|nr:4Fe-4S dicluster protein [Bacteroidota bacterium]
MKRTVIKIDEQKCNGCGLCVTGCHEGALQLIDGKAVMISDMFCDGLGACIGECPVGAIELIEREAEKYDEIAVMERLVHKGTNVILAHLKHMKDHNETEYLRQGIEYIKKNNIDVDVTKLEQKQEEPKMACGCPGSMAKSFAKKEENNDMIGNVAQKSELTHWPIQLHLQNPMAPYFQNANVLIAADCTAFSLGAFHSQLLKNKILSIACPKLDANKEIYVEKIVSMIDDSKIDTLTIAIMEVPCCGGLLELAKLARQNASRNIPIKQIVISVQGEIISENWI